MAEQSILVCDVCGTPAATTVSIKADGKSVHKDLCSDHLGELMQGTRRARPGRRRSVGSTPKRATAPAGTRRKTAARKSTSKKSTSKVASRRGARSRQAAKPQATRAAAQETPAGAAQEGP